MFSSSSFDFPESTVHLILLRIHAGCRNRKRPSDKKSKPAAKPAVAAQAGQRCQGQDNRKLRRWSVRPQASAKHRCTAQSLRTRCSCLVVLLLLTPVTLCFLLFSACSAYLVAFSTFFGFCECFLQFASVLLQFCVLAFTVMRCNAL